MIIICDVDGVLNNLMEATIDIYNKTYAAHYTLQDITTYNLENCLDRNIAKQMKDIFKSASVWDHVKPIKGAQDGIEKLIREGHQVYLVTNHAPDTYKEKVEWIKRFFPFVDASRIVCMQDKWLLRADIMIEDCMQTLLAKPYYHRILMSHPWNHQSNFRDCCHDIHRCKNWDSIINVINKIVEMESDVK